MTHTSDIYWANLQDEFQDMQNKARKNVQKPKVS